MGGLFKGKEFKNYKFQLASKQIEKEEEKSKDAVVTEALVVEEATQEKEEEEEVPTPDLGAMIISKDDLN